MNIKPPVRIAHIIGKMCAGGVESVVFNYYRALDHNRIQFDFYYDDDSTVEPPKDLIDMGARFVELPPYQKSLLYIRELRKHLKKNKYVVIHSHLNTISVFPLYAAWKENVPVRIAHNHSVPGGNELKKNIAKQILRRFSRIFSTDYFACSEKAGRWLFGDKKFEEGKVTVIKNAIDFERFRPSKEKLIPLRSSLGLENKFVVGHVGRFTFAKNHKFLIEIFKKISEKRANAVLLLVGDGEMHEQIHQWVKKYEMENVVRFVGRVTNPEMYYRLMNVMTIPSIFEGLSIATIESQIAGIPVVASMSVPEEAVISDGCIRLPLDKQIWVDTILDTSNKEIQLNSKSKDYNIQYASKLLENWYLNKVGELNEKSICDNGNI